MTVEELYKFINVNPGKGLPSVFWGTKITPEHILQDLKNGLTAEEISSQHPAITPAHIEAAKIYREVFPTDSERLAMIALGILGWS